MDKWTGFRFFNCLFSVPDRSLSTGFQPGTEQRASSRVAFVVRSAKAQTSSVTTAKPRPCSPALATLFDLLQQPRVFLGLLKSR